jgi:hypothetical protein
VLGLEERFPCYNAVHKMGAEVGDPVVLFNPSEVVEVMKDVPWGQAHHHCRNMKENFNKTRGQSVL